MSRDAGESKSESGIAGDLEAGEFNGSFHASGVAYVWGYDPKLFIASARCKGQRVAKLTALYQGDGVMLLSDIRFESADSLPPSLMTRLWQKFRPRPTAESFRGRGIGTQLLETFLEFCRNHGIAEIYGSVVQTDLDANRSLIGWYERHGFVERPPDRRVLHGSASMVVWTPRNHVPSGEIGD